MPIHLPIHQSSNHLILSLPYDSQKANKQETIRTKISKGNLRAVISRRYRGPIAERVMSKLPEFQNPQSYDLYIELIERLLNFDQDKLLKIAFDVYDFN